MAHPCSHKESLLGFCSTAAQALFQVQGKDSAQSSQFHGVQKASPSSLCWAPLHHTVTCHSKLCVPAARNKLGDAVVQYFVLAQQGQAASRSFCLSPLCSETARVSVVLRQLRALWAGQEHLLGEGREDTSVTCMWTRVPSPLFSSYHSVLLHHLLLGFDCCLNQYCA